MTKNGFHSRSATLLTRTLKIFCSLFIAASIVSAPPALAQNNAPTKADAVEFFGKLVAGGLLKVSGGNEATYDEFRYKIQHITAYKNNCEMVLYSGNARYHKSHRDGWKEGSFEITIDWTKVTKFKPPTHRSEVLFIVDGITETMSGKDRHVLHVDLAGNVPDPESLKKRIVKAAQFLHEACYIDPLKGSKF